MSESSVAAVSTSHTGPAANAAAAHETPSPQIPQNSARIKRDWLFHLVLLAMCGGVLVLSATLSVKNRTQVVLPGLGVALPELCLMRRASGLSCPGCGLTRSFISLAHGDVARAWSYNPSGPLLFFLVALQVPFRALQVWRIRCGWPELNTGMVGPIALGTFALVMVGQWMLGMAAAVL
jgi:uncharacterized protein DUF2752